MTPPIKRKHLMHLANNYFSEMKADKILSLSQSQPTPFYFYDMELLYNNLSSASEAVKRYGYHMHYALKANSNEPILRSYYIRS